MRGESGERDRGEDWGDGRAHSVPAGQLVVNYTLNMKQNRDYIATKKLEPPQKEKRGKKLGAA